MHVYAHQIATRMSEYKRCWLFNGAQRKIQTTLSSCILIIPKWKQSSVQFKSTGPAVSCVCVSYLKQGKEEKRVPLWKDQKHTQKHCRKLTSLLHSTVSYNIFTHVHWLCYSMRYFNMLCYIRLSFVRCLGSVLLSTPGWRRWKSLISKLYWCSSSLLESHMPEVFVTL